MPRRPVLAVSLHVQGRRAVVVGAGPLAEERRSRLLDAGAHVTVVPDPTAPAALDGAAVVLCVDPSLGEQAVAARPPGALVYVQDRPDLSDFSMPALARRGPLTIAVATDGLAPALARRFREQLEALLSASGTSLDKLIEEMARIRDSGDKDRLSVTAAKLRVSGRIEIDP